MTGFWTCCVFCIFGCSSIVEGFVIPTPHLNRITGSGNAISPSFAFKVATKSSPTKRIIGKPTVRMMSGEDISGVAVILLAGGVGSRMKADRPKQFLELEGKPILFHSLDLFLTLSGIISITVVIAEEYRDMFNDLKARESRLRFASPGKERQVLNPPVRTPRIKAHSSLIPPAHAGRTPFSMACKPSLPTRGSSACTTPRARW
jgi:hypothetical protein